MFDIDEKRSCGYYISMQKHSFIHQNVHEKKVLALVLAFACAFTMFAGAAFTDSADIQQTEAVDMLTALGVIDGYEDGSFQPDKTVTRAEMAKMIYIIRTGSSDASAYNDDATTFTDITDHWARGYIKYCQSLGVISGKSTTIFDPNSTVTTQEAAKMLLVTLGYNAERAGLEGTGWGQKTTALADENGLLKDVNCGTTQGMPRQYAAQLIYNAIFANAVSLRDGEYTKYGYDNSLNPTIGEKYMDLYKTEAGVLFECDLVDGKDYYTITTSGYLDADNNRVTTFNKVPTDVSSLIGQEIIVLRKVNASDVTVYGVYADEDSKVVATGYVGQLETASDSDKIKLDGTEYKLDGTKDSNIVYRVNQDTTAYSTLDAQANTVTGANRTRNNASAEIKLIDNDGNGKVDFAVITPVEIGKVNAVTSTSVTIDNGIGTVKFADDTIYDDVAKGDYVRVIDDANTSSGGSHVEKLDVVNATVEGTRTGEAKVNGTWYKLAYVNGSYVTADTNTTYDMVIVGNTILYAEETEGSVTDVAYIGGVATSEDTIVGDSNISVKVRMYFADGTDAEVKVSKLDGEKLKTGETTVDNDNDFGIADIQPLENDMVTYTKLSDGTYDIKAVASGNLAGCDEFEPSGTPASGASNSAYYDSKICGVSIADDAVIFVETGDETKVLTGAQVKNWAKEIKHNGSVVVFTSAYLTDESNGIDYIKAATLVTAIGISVPGSKDTSYAYAVVDQYTATLNGEKKIAVDAWNGSETVTLYADGLSFENNINAGDLFSYKVNGDYIEDVAVATHTAAVLGFDGKAEGELKVQDADGVSAAKTYTLAEDCVVLTVDDANTNGVAGASLDSIVEAGYNTAGNRRVANISYMFGTGDDADKIIAIIVDAENNKMDPEVVTAVVTP